MANRKTRLVNKNEKLLFKQLKDNESISCCLKWLSEEQVLSGEKFFLTAVGKKNFFLEICTSSFSMPGIIFPHYRNKLCKEHIFCKWVYSRNKLYSGLLHHMHTPWHKQMCHCSRLEETVCTYVHVHKTKVLYSQSFWGVVNLYCRVCTRCLMVSNNQADPSCFYFRISWILMERRWFFFVPSIYCKASEVPT